MKLLVSTVLVLLATPSSAAILTVGPPGSGAQFEQINAAIAAAQPNDTILVQPGTYAPFLVDKPVRVIGDGTGDVIVQTAISTGITVDAIGPGEEVVLSGLEVQATPVCSGTIASILVRASAGTVVLHDVLVDHPASQVGLLVLGSDRVLLLSSRILDAGLDCTGMGLGAVTAASSELWIADSEISGLQPFSPFGIPLPGRHGVEVADSTLHVWRSKIRGGDAEPGFTSSSITPDGGAGIDATDSTVNLYGGSVDDEIRGGDGDVSLSLVVGEGGPGVALQAGSSARIQQDLTVVGGLDGNGAVQAPAVDADGTSAATFESRIFPTLASVFPQIGTGGIVALVLEGTPLAPQVLVVDFQTGPTLTLPGTDGMGYLDPSTAVQLELLTISPTGTTVLMLPVPPNPALVGATAFLQSLEASGGQVVFGNPALVTVTQ